MKTLKAIKATFGGNILKRIKELSKDKTQYGFEIVTLVKGLTGAVYITMLHLQYLRVEESGDYLILHYPAEELNVNMFKKYKDKYSLEDQVKMVKYILEDVKDLSILEFNYHFILFQRGKELVKIERK